MSAAPPTPDWQPSFARFWPTVLARRTLAEHAPRNAALAKLLLDMDRRSEQLTTRYQGADLLALDHPAIVWLRDGVNETVRAYLACVGVGYPVRWQLQAWANVNRRGDYHAPHNHAWCYLSGTYYVRVPRAAPGGASGAISFFNPRAGAGASRLTGGRAGEAEITLLPEAGTVLLWHAALNHLVHPNLAGEPRISISFNVVLEWANHYVGNPA